MTTAIGYERQRPLYIPSNRVKWETFIPAFVGLITAAAVGAMILYFAFISGYYYIFLTPLIVAMPLAWLNQTVIRVGHCRSPMIALGLGLIVAAIFYLGYFYIGMLHIVGPAGLLRPDLLLRYISLRQQTDTQVDTTTHSSTGSSPFMNWFAFLLESGLVIYLVAWLGFRRAHRAYCEKCGRWQDQSYMLLAPRQGRTVASWLASGQLNQLMKVPTIQQNISRSARFTTVLFERCSPDCASHLSAKDVRYGNTLTTFQMFDGAGGLVRVRRAIMSPAEHAVVAQTFALPGRTHSGRMDPPAPLQE
jgi:hypothetical protein